MAVIIAVFMLFLPDKSNACFCGDGFPKNIQLAFEWDYNATERGQVEAQKAVADIYLRGEGTRINRRETLYE
ncbi:sel1 repeat family protein [Salmonella enterica subsp. salamae]|nr:sel1 repeat family protein [Salmonella enterica subsp. salamae]HCC0890499.1 sel1 repeat family protein [Salmonella enterica]